LIHDPIEAAQREAVHDLLAPAFGLDEAAVTETREVRADAGLRLRDRGDQLTDGALTVAEEFQDLKPGWIPQDAKETGRRRAVGWR
jgi:hypothetical protein